MFPAVFKASKNVYLKIDRVHQIQIYHQNDYHLVLWAIYTMAMLNNQRVNNHKMGG